MSCARVSAGRLLASLLLLSALVVIALPAMGMVASPASVALEACLSCQGCDEGSCNDPTPLGSDHCCLSSCLAHAVWALCAQPEPPRPSRCGDALSQDQESPVRPAPEAVYQPPRR